MTDRLISEAQAIEALLKAFAFHNYAGATAANVIRQLPTIEAEPFNCSLEEFGECSYKETGCSDCKVKEKVRNAIEAEPIKHGEWLPYGEWQVECSECGFVTTFLGEGHYCPRCGSKMDERKYIVCPKCGQKFIDHDTTSEVICGHCGAVIREAAND